MIDYLKLKDDIKNGKIQNSYILVGFNENLIKEDIREISNVVLKNHINDFNYVAFDGNNVTFDEIINACETVPFLSDHKVVVVFRAVFLEDGGKMQGVSAETTYKAISNYIGKVPKFCTLILYTVFDEKREKISKKLRSLDKKTTVVEYKQLRNVSLQKKVREYFKNRDKTIGNSELAYFCNSLENNLTLIENEVEKLCSYVDIGEIKKEDIIKLLPPKNDNDIFNLVEFITEQKTKKSLDVLDELLFRGEKFTGILSMIERQFKLLLSIKLLHKEGKRNDEISKKLRLNSFICDKMINQSRRYSEEILQKILILCLESERKLKSLSIDARIELETLLIKIAVIK